MSDPLGRLNTPLGSMQFANTQERPKFDLPRVDIPVPSAEIAKDWNAMGQLPFAGKLSRTFSLLGNVLALPGEGAARLVSGNTAPTFGHIEPVRDLFSFSGKLSPETSAHFANFVMDPLNLMFGVSAGAEAARGAIASTEMLDMLRSQRAWKVWRNTKSAADLAFESSEEARLFAAAAGINARPIQAKPLLGFNLQVDKLSPQVVSVLTNQGFDVNNLIQAQSKKDAYKIVKQALAGTPEAKTKIGSSVFKPAYEEHSKYILDFSNWDDTERKAATELIENYLSGAKTYEKDPKTFLYSGIIEGEKLKPGVMGFVKRLFGKPELGTPYTKYGSEIMRDSDKAYFAAAQGYKNDLGKELLADLNVGNGSALRRAFAYSVRGIEQNQWDDDAIKAMRSYGVENFRSKSGFLQNKVKQILVESGETISGGKAPLSEVMDREILRLTKGKDISEENLVYLPTAFQHHLSGTKRIDNTLKELDIVEDLDWLLHSKLRSSYRKEGVNAVNELKKSMTAGGVKLGTGEEQLIESMLSMFKGAPRKEDLWLNSVLLDNKDAIQKNKVIHKLLDLALGTDKQGALELAAQGRPLMSEASRKIRSGIYSGLLGGAIDSAVRNVTQLMNPMVEYGWGKTAAGAGAYLSNKELREAVKPFIDTTSSVMTEALEHQSLTKRHTVMDAVFAPMHFTENLNRGITFTTALQDAAQSMPIGEAIRYAEAQTRKLQFGYSIYDVNPFMTDSPIKRLAFQFTNFPVRQLELLAGWAKEAKTDKAKIIRWLALTGGTIANGHRMGVDMSNVLGFGLGFSQYPPYINLDPGGVLPPNLNIAAAAPIVRATEEGLGLAKDFTTMVFTGITGSGMQTDPSESPSKMWKRFTALLRFGVMAGMQPVLDRAIGKTASANVTGAAVLLTSRYAQKGYDNLIEGLLEGSPEVRKKYFEDPSALALGQALGVNLDSGVNTSDRIVRMLGFQTTRDKERKEVLEFLGSFTKRYKQAVTEMNNAVATGGDYREIQGKWRKNMMNMYGPVFNRWNIPDYVLLNSLSPSPGMFTYKGRISRENLLLAPAEQRKTMGIKSELREMIEPALIEQFGEE